MIYKNPIILEKLVESDSDEKFYFKEHYQKYYFL